jgi:hypothetical protein
VPGSTTVFGASTCELRELSVQVVGSLRDVTRMDRVTIVAGTGGSIDCGSPATFTRLTVQSFGPIHAFQVGGTQPSAVVLRDCSLSGANFARVAVGSTLEIVGSDIAATSATTDNLVNDGQLIVRHSKLIGPPGAQAIKNNPQASVTIEDSEISGDVDIRNEGNIKVYGSRLLIGQFQNGPGTAFVGGSYVAPGVHLGGNCTCAGLYSDASFFGTTCP